MSPAELLVRGRWVITDAADREAGVHSDAAVLVSGPRITAVGDWRALRRAIHAPASSATARSCSCRAWSTRTATAAR